MGRSGLILDDKLKAETKLYRYMPLSQFMHMIEKGETYLTSIKYWEDEWELPISKFTKELSKKEFNSNKDLYGQCWSLEGVSDALWKIYSPSKEGILIETAASKFNLISNIKFGMLSPVIYYSDLKQAYLALEDIKDPKKTFAEGLLKRYAFKHENEVRLIVINNEECLGKRYENCEHINLKINPIEFIDSIIIDPRASEWYVETIQSYCLRSGFSIVPMKSDLYCPVP